MNGINKQQTGFKFGQHRLTVEKNHGEIKHNGRTYRLLSVLTHDGLPYYSLRLYNGTGKFIKQFLIDPEAFEDVAGLMCKVLYGPDDSH